VRRGLLAPIVALVLAAAAGTTLIHHASAGPPPPGSELTAEQVTATSRLVADHWIAENPAEQGDNKWANCTIHSGLMALHGSTKDRKYHDHSLAWAEKHDWAIVTGDKKPDHWADHQCAGQVYLDLYAVQKDKKRIAAIERDVATQLASGRSDYWSWVDALHMAMPVVARLGVQRGDETYLKRMDEMYRHTRDEAGGEGYLDETKGLWWRDDDFVGSSTYWSRGNGWAIAALVKVLAALPADDPRRDDYAATVKTMAEALRKIQRPDGFWSVNLGDPKDFPGPETSGTAMFAYGLAWGVNNGVLDAATYQPVVERAWQGMAGKAVHDNGLLGYVQDVGKQPSDSQPVTETTTAVFAVGAFLLAGTEVARMVDARPPKK
jgi:unsaturated rhamnogalacturonyl hydrolase